MKILVADDDALIRRLLLALLGKLGHEVEAVEDGNVARKILESASPPALAIMDWVMPGMNGIEVCKHLRAHPSRLRPYVLLLSAKADKQDVIAGLDAGADDYLVKPFDPMALLARLRVAQRIITYQQELQQHIGEMETLLQRHNLLGEMFGRQGRAGEPGSVAARARPAASLAAAPQVAPAQIDQMLARGLTEIGLADARVAALANPPAKVESAFTAWAPLVLVKEGLWIDLLLEAEEASAVTAFETLLGRIPVSERELLDFLAETFNLLCTALKNSLTDQGSVVLAPVISRSTRSGSVTVKRPALCEESRHRITFSDAAIEITALRQAAPVVDKSLGQLHEMDILAENLPSPSTTEVFLLNQGVVLNLRYIEKLSSLAKAENKELRVPVFEPSPLTEFFCLGRIRG
jgi:CheY-like chemotaxis protein